MCVVLLSHKCVACETIKHSHKLTNSNGVDRVSIAIIVTVVSIGPAIASSKYKDITIAISSPGYCELKSLL